MGARLREPWTRAVADIIVSRMRLREEPDMCFGEAPVHRAAAFVMEAMAAAPECERLSERAAGLFSERDHEDPSEGVFASAVEACDGLEFEQEAFRGIAQALGSVRFSAVPANVVSTAHRVEPPCDQGSGPGDPAAEMATAAALRLLNESKDALRAAAAIEALVSLGPGPSAFMLARRVEETDLEVVLVSDAPHPETHPDGIAEAYGVDRSELAQCPGSRRWSLPGGARYVARPRMPSGALPTASQVSDMHDAAVEFVEREGRRVDIGASEPLRDGDVAVMSAGAKTPLAGWEASCATDLAREAGLPASAILCVRDPGAPVPTGGVVFARRSELPTDTHFAGTRTDSAVVPPRGALAPSNSGPVWTSTSKECEGHGGEHAPVRGSRDLCWWWVRCPGGESIADLAAECGVSIASITAIPENARDLPHHCSFPSVPLPAGAAVVLPRGSSGPEIVRRRGELRKGDSPFRRYAAGVAALAFRAGLAKEYGGCVARAGRGAVGFEGAAMDMSRLLRSPEMPSYPGRSSRLSELSRRLSGASREVRIPADSGPEGPRGTADVVEAREVDDRLGDFLSDASNSAAQSAAFECAAAGMFPARHPGGVSREHSVAACAVRGAFEAVSPSRCVHLLWLLASSGKTCRATMAPVRGRVHAERVPERMDPWGYVVQKTHTFADREVASRFREFRTREVAAEAALGSADAMRELREFRRAFGERLKGSESVLVAALHAWSLNPGIVPLSGRRAARAAMSRGLDRIHMVGMGDAGEVALPILPAGASASSASQGDTIRFLEQAVRVGAADQEVLERAVSGPPVDLEAWRRELDIVAGNRRRLRSAGIE